MWTHAKHLFLFLLVSCMRNCTMFSRNGSRKTSILLRKGGMEANTNDEDANERVFRMSYNACVLVYVQTVNRSYIAICSDWFW